MVIREMFKFNLYTEDIFAVGSLPTQNFYKVPYVGSYIEAHFIIFQLN